MESSQGSVVIASRPLAARMVADEMEALIHERRRAGANAVFGIASGRTPLMLYDELARRVREEGLELDNVVTFNLDEYAGFSPQHPQSLHSFMRTNLFLRIGLGEHATHTPDCSAVNGQVVHLRADVRPLMAVDLRADARPLMAVDLRADARPLMAIDQCAAYELAIAAAGGIDLLVLGIGRNGHIGFNEPGSSRQSYTREVELAATTREDAVDAFGSLDEVPTRGVTMGVATMLAARRIRLLAFGPTKRHIVRRLHDATIGPELPATYLREHPDFRMYLDQDAAEA